MGPNRISNTFLISTTFSRISSTMAQIMAKFDELYLHSGDYDKLISDKIVSPDVIFEAPLFFGEFVGDAHLVEQMHKNKPHLNGITVNALEEVEPNVFTRVISQPGKFIGSTE